MSTDQCFTELFEQSKTCETRRKITKTGFAGKILGNDSEQRLLTPPVARD
jgi:hypothetical protein